jgi:uncharacterized protein (TIGR00251 family)
MLRADADAVLLAIRVQPRASRARIAGERAGRLVVQVNAPPVEGRANDALCRLLAKALGVAPGRIAVVSGERGRDKVVRIEGIAVQDVAERLANGG